MAHRILILAGLVAFLGACTGPTAPPPADSRPPAGRPTPPPADPPAEVPTAGSPDGPTGAPGADTATGPDAMEEQPPPGVFHRVRRGQTLYTIARTYDVTLRSIVEVNDIEDPNRIAADVLLFIPGAAQLEDVPITVGPLPGVAFRLPADGPINSRFGPRWGRMHYGLDIGAPAGAAVRAARAGRVLYAGNGYRGYGRLVILDHGDGFQTLYAHNRRLRTQAGRNVKEGEVIAEVGATGNATGPHLHFEIRLEDRPVDPLPYLGSGS